MKIEQVEPNFKPIAITLNTREEANAFFRIVNGIDQSTEVNGVRCTGLTSIERNLIRSIADSMLNKEW